MLIIFMINYIIKIDKIVLRIGEKLQPCNRYQECVNCALGDMPKCYYQLLISDNENNKT